MEPRKPRLYHNALFLNLWMANVPFKLDSLVHHHNGQLQVHLNCAPYSILWIWDERNLVAANSAIFLVTYYLAQLGNFRGISKSILYPAQDVPYLGFLLDSTQQVFFGASDIGLFNCVSQDPPTTCGQVHFVFSCHSRCPPVYKRNELGHF